MTKKPNLLFLMTDQQRAQTLGLHSCKTEITPSLNRLAERSICFERAYDACPLCVPARTALATGVNPLQSGMRYNDLPGVYATDVKPLHQYLFESGYEVAHIGVQHISLRPPLSGRVQWSRFITDEDYAAWAKERGIATGRGARDAVEIEELCDGAYHRRAYSGARVSGWEHPLEAFKDVWFSNRAEEWLSGRKEGPFALFLCLWAPHPPLIVPAEYAALFDPAQIELPENVGIPADGEPENRRHGAPAQLAAGLGRQDWKKAYAAHYALTRLCDDQIGRLLKTLERTGHGEDTLVVFTTDHGEQLGQHAMYQKMEMYEPAVRVPALFALPGHGAARLATPVSHLDFLPTLLELLDIAPEREYEGISLAEAMRSGKEPPAHDIFGCYCGNHLPGDQRRMIVRDNFKLVLDGFGGRELFDLKSDPLEMRNLTQAEPERVRILEEALRGWMLRSGDSLMAAR